MFSNLKDLYEDSGAPSALLDNSENFVARDTFNSGILWESLKKTPF